MGSPLRALASIAAHFRKSTHLDEAVGHVLRILGEELQLQRVSLAVLDPPTGHIVIRAGHGLTPAEVRRGRYAFGEGVIGEVVRAGEAAFVPRIRADARFLDKTGALEAGVDRAFVCVPIITEEQVVGALSAYRPAEHPTLAGDVELLEIVGGLAAPLVRDAVGRVGDEPDGERSPPDMIGRSKSMSDVYRLINQVAASPTTVLLRGESGTGKELVANAIHADSPRRRGPFVKVNCAALPDTVIESELFGHERGAFTGAIQRRQGRFERADGGTIFLDEIGDLSLGVQVKLLRVLQQRAFERVGGDRTLTVDVRIIAATSRDLEAMMETGSFRADLYYRLNVFPIRVPPLRDRRSDILLLTDHFVELFNRAHGRSVRRISTPAIDMLLAYHWPGNVRELANCIERAVLIARDDVLHGHHLPPTLQTAEATDTGPREGLKAQLARVEREILMDALKSSRGNMAAAARELQVSERIVGLRVEKYGISLTRFKNPTEM